LVDFKQLEGSEVAAIYEMISRFHIYAHFRYLHTK